MRLYLACTIRGNRDALAIVRALCDRLEHHGHDVLTRRFLDDDVDAKEGQLSERDVFLRDIAWLDACDALVAEASGSSYGVGFEVGYVLGRAERTGQKVYLLYDEARRPQISRMIPGAAHPACVAMGYRTTEDVVRFVDEEFGGRAG